MNNSTDTAEILSYHVAIVKNNVTRRNDRLKCRISNEHLFYTTIMPMKYALCDNFRLLLLVGWLWMYPKKKSLSVTCGRLVVLSGYSGFLHQENWPPRYNWNITESSIKHHKPPTSTMSYLCYICLFACTCVQHVLTMSNMVGVL